LRKGLVQLGVSLLIGLPAAFALGSIAQLQLIGIEPSDPLTMIGISIVVIAVALIACVVPARKAANVDPMIALRSE
jgi:ABC-type antimicrobial peptide transport system permease subunit